uniref:Uncharacterized protein n=1 Tax=Arundo donax TaxID=35708 RepID=A0A0A9G2W0_ARUDO
MQPRMVLWYYVVQHCALTRHVWITVQLRYLRVVYNIVHYNVIAVPEYSFIPVTTKFQQW